MLRALSKEVVESTAHGTLLPAPYLIGLQSRQSAKLFIQSSTLGLQPLHPQAIGQGSTNSDERTYTVVLYVYICTLYFDL